jgi:NarL family two-component system sensor histidine kinase LiaS
MLFFKEGINNAARYADASRIDLTIDQTRNAIVCCVLDNGRGFDVAAGSAQGGRGLRNMRTRATTLSGRLDILSTPGAGTSLTLTVPLTRKVPGA